MQATVLTRDAQLDGLAEPWRRLVGVEQSPFSSFEWCREYLRWVQPEPPLVVVVRDKGIVRAIAPLARAGQEAHPICDHLTDHSTLWLGDEAAVPLILHTLRECGVRRLRGHAVRRVPAGAQAGSAVPCQVLALSGDGCCHRSLRRHLDRAERQLSTVAPVRLRVEPVQPKTMATFLTRVDHWRAATGRPALADSVARRRFFLALAGSPPVADQMLLATLCRADEHISTLMCFVLGERLGYYAGGHNPQLARFGPGLLALDHVIRWARSSGYRQLDFLRGDEPYKTRLGAVTAYSVYDFALELPERQPCS
jgi:CelD/BcsL family acetyltransferase involved in cellulose biosynthesis